MRYMINYKPAFDFDKVLDNVFSGNSYDSERKPPVNIMDEKERYLLEAELPGLNESEVDVKLDDRILTISSNIQEQVPEQKDKESKSFLIRERRRTAFSRSFALPRDVGIEKISASFVNGILTLTLEKVPEVKPRKIEVKAA